MKIVFCLLFLSTFIGELHAAGGRIVTSLDAGWRFFHGDITGAQVAAFDDSSWRRLDVPHDWSIEGPFAASNPTGAAGGFLPAGVGWYRKDFTLPQAYAGRRIFIEFDGVMANSDVWINGQHLGKRPYGYVGFSYELTGHLVFGKGSNILAVRADNTRQPASRWYTGAGMYRHVRLAVLNPVHFARYGTFITTPKVTARRAGLHIETAIANQDLDPHAISLQIVLKDPKGKPAGRIRTKPRRIAPGQTENFQEELTVAAPHLWQLDNPALYTAELSIRYAGTLADQEIVSFGIREARFLPETGFWLNGKNIRIKGVGLHHDGGAFGAAVPLRVWEQRLRQLRRLGVNAIRTAHNPPASEFLNLCDRMGFLVIDELFDCWTVGKTPFDYHLYFKDWAHADVRDTVLRDRNHPSVILYSAGNEIHDTPKEDLAKKILAELVQVFHQYDPSRPVTQALFRPNISHDYDNGLADLLDVVGTNYRDLELLAAHKAKPSRKILGTEQRHDRDTWLAARDHPEHAGQFLWSGIDYLGESFGWPMIAAGYGLLDRTGAIKPMALERQSWWSEKPVVHIVRRTQAEALLPTDPGFAPLKTGQSQFADWTPENTKPHEESVEAYSNCDEVELLLNGRSLGSKRRNADDSPRVWNIAWEAGVLQAVAKNKGRIVAEDALRSAGAPVKIMLSADRPLLTPAWDDVVFITATITDAHGIAVPYASDLVSFSVEGPGVVAAVDNGNNTDTDPFQASQRHAYQGRCVVMIKANASSGRIQVTASTKGIQSATVFIKVIPSRKIK